MDKAYWNNLADDYENEVFSVLSNDSNDLIKDRIARISRKMGNTCTDLGCGIGFFLPLLAEHFKKVYAVDLADSFIKRARKYTADLDNIEFMLADASKPNCRLPVAECILSVNAILTPSLGKRRQMFKTISSHLLPGGSLILVVPSLESVLLTKHRLVEWNLRDGLSPASAVRSGFQAGSDTAARVLRQGIVDVDDVPTKHYLREELMATLSGHGFDVGEIHKIQYSWKTEFVEPPAWMTEPYPWDWLVTARKSVSSKR